MQTNTVNPVTVLLYYAYALCSSFYIKAGYISGFHPWHELH